jgi:hypothetical protein
MESETRRIFEELRKSVTHLGIWKTKGTCAGSGAVMKAVSNLEEFFRSFCDDKACLATQKHPKECEKVE